MFNETRARPFAHTNHGPKWKKVECFGGVEWRKVVSCTVILSNRGHWDPPTRTQIGPTCRAIPTQTSTQKQNPRQFEGQLSIHSLSLNCTGRCGSNRMVFLSSILGASWVLVGSQLGPSSWVLVAQLLVMESFLASFLGFQV